MCIRDSNVAGGEVTDLRPVILDGAIVLVYRYVGPIAGRFDGQGSRATIAEDAVFSPDEARDLATFANRIGLDCGEIDVLRDADGTIYVVDVAKTPAGPEVSLGEVEGHAAVQRMAAAFADLIARQAGTPARLDVPRGAETTAAPGERAAATING